ncbi:hypothetical protein Tco_1490490 [Tanacetum coccineum]
MSTYLKNMGGYKYNQLKSKSYDEIHKLFDNEMKRLKKAESSEKKAEGSRKKSIEAEEDDEVEMKKHMEIVQDDEEISIDAIPLATKPPMIVEYKIVKERQKGFYHLIRADRSSNRYSLMIRMLQNNSREDLETLWKLVKTKHGNTRPEDDYERVFWGDLKVMFEPDIKSEVWRNLQGYKVTVWKLFDSSGIQKMSIKFRGGLLGLKDFKMIIRVTTAQSKRFIKRTGKKLDVNGQRVGFESGNSTENALGYSRWELENMIGATMLKEEHSYKLYIDAYSLQEVLPIQDTKFKTGLGYNTASSTAASPAVESFVNSSEMLENQENNKSKSDKGYHAVPPPYTGNFIPFKPDLTFMDEIVESENIDVITVVTSSNVKKVESNHKSGDVKNNDDAVEPKTVRKNSFRPLIIEDWNSDDYSKVEFIPNVKDKTVRQH